MALNPANYNHRGGGNYGIVLQCPDVVGSEHLVYFDHNRDRGTWVIRDLIAGRRLDDNGSSLTEAQIEAAATYDEFPPWLNVELNPADWRTYLTLRATAVMKRTSESTLAPPNPNSGSWQPL
ncbi:MAG: hypothetical protein WBL63_26295 [Candidatus Acidiferrum sp.]